jgi:hypothetical protein
MTGLSDVLDTDSANRGGYQIGRDQLTWAGPHLPPSLEPTGTCHHNRESSVSANRYTILRNKYSENSHYVAVSWQGCSAHVTE